MLVSEQAMRLKALSDEESEKIAAVQELIQDTEKDIVSLKELIDKIKKEMGNEDLPLLRVKEQHSPQCCFVSRVLIVFYDLHQTNVNHSFFCFRTSRI